MPESGDWIGFYTYGDGQAHHTMELNIAFGGAVITGRGMDDIGRFSVSGTCGGADCSWVKAYETHSVQYRGCLESQKIWGTWAAGSNRGGFMLWPRKNDGEVVAIEAERSGERAKGFGGSIHAKPK